MYNKITLVGNLTRDVEIKHTQSGSTIGNVGIATSRKWRDKSGEQKEEVMFIDLTLFGRTAEIADQYLRKGSKVLVDGRLQLQQWTAQDGSKRSKHAVTVESLQMLNNKVESQAQQDPQAQPQYQAQEPQAQQPYQAQPQVQQLQAQQQQQLQRDYTISDGDIPF